MTKTRGLQRLWDKYECAFEKMQNMLAELLICLYHAQQLHELLVVIQSTQANLNLCRNREALGAVWRLPDNGVHDHA